MTIKKNVEISVSSETRQVFFEDNFLGLTGENLQGYIVFSFKDQFVSGIPRVELIQGENKYYITEIETENETYKLPIKSSLLTSNNVYMQLVITENGEENSIPIFKSKTFYLYVAESINAITTIPEEYATWIDTLNEKVLEINLKLEECDTAITQANNLDLDVSKEGKTATITLNKKDNTTKVVTLSDGTSLMFNWEGTSLGIKTDEDADYTYVDLQGSTGLTPNIQIGTVVSGDTVSVTRTGTNENPIFNFVLKPGASVTSASINANGELVLTVE